MPPLQDRLNFGVKFFISILTLAQRFLFIYEQKQATDIIRDRSKPTQTKLTSASIQPVVVSYYQ